MDDEVLLRFYLELHGPQAAPWNLSPQNAYAEYRMRQFLADHQQIAQGMTVCNIGIGAGYWDTYLTYWLGAEGSVTSIDIDPAICAVHQYRQRREENPHPSTVVCGDIRRPPQTLGTFDLVTVVSVEAGEETEYRAFLDGAFALLKPGGRLFYWELCQRHAVSQFQCYAREACRFVETFEIDERYSTFAFYIVMASAVAAVWRDHGPKAVT